MPLSKLIRNPIDALVRIINDLLLLGFCVAMLFAQDERTVDIGLIGLLGLFIAWVTTIMLYNNYLDRWHKYYCNNKRQYIMRRQTWQADITGDRYSDFQYCPINK